MTDKPEITPAILLDHMQGMKQELQTQMSVMNTTLEEVDCNAKTLVTKVDQLDRRVGMLEIGITNIDERLDGIETSLLDQKHEERIVRLEHAVGFPHGV